MPGIDPFSAVTSGAQTLLGIGQAIAGGIKARRAQRQLENLQTPKYNESKSILDYYNTALQRYNQNPSQTQQYQVANQQANANFGSGVNALQSRAAAVGGISRLSALRNNAGLKAGVAAEQEQNQRFGQLGGAAQAKAGEDRLSFQYNQLAPYEKKYNLLAMKGGAANQTANAGIQNIFGGLGALQDYNMLDKYYGGQTQKKQPQINNPWE